MFSFVIVPVFIIIIIAIIMSVLLFVWGEHVIPPLKEDNGDRGKVCMLGAGLWGCLVRHLRLSPWVWPAVFFFFPSMTAAGDEDMRLPQP